MDESLAMAEIAAATGVGVIIATPHVETDQDATMSHGIEEAVDSLQAEIDRRGLALRVLPGAEVFPSVSTPKWLDAGYPITLGKNGSYILLDCSLTTMPVGLGELVFQLQSRGVTPILAHPERTLPIQRNPRLLESLVHSGMLIQLDALSVLGKHGPSAAATARLLLRHRWVHFLASDAHSPNHSRPRLVQAAQALTGVIGADEVRALVQDNPDRLLKGETIPTHPADYAPSRSLAFLTNLFHRRAA